MIQIGGVYTTFCQEGGILLQKYAIEMGGVSRYISKVSGSGVDLTLLIGGVSQENRATPPSKGPVRLVADCLVEGCLGLPGVFPDIF